MINLGWHRPAGKVLTETDVKLSFQCTHTYDRRKKTSMNCICCYGDSADWRGIVLSSRSSPWLVIPSVWEICGGFLTFVRKMEEVRLYLFRVLRERLAPVFNLRQMSTEQKICKEKWKEHRRFCRWLRDVKRAAFLQAIRTCLRNLLHLLSQTFSGAPNINEAFNKAVNQSATNSYQTWKQKQHITEFLKRNYIATLQICPRNFHKTIPGQASFCSCKYTRMRRGDIGGGCGFLHNL